MPFERPLGSNEKVTWILDQAAPMNFVVVTQIEGDLNPSAIQTSLESLVDMHPFLSACIEERADGPWVVTGKGVKLSLRLLDRKDSNHWQIINEKELNEPFDRSAGPLMRATLLHSHTVCDLILTFYHPVSDGFSGIYVMRDLLNLAGDWYPDTHTNPKVIYQPRPPAEQLLPASAKGFPGFCKTVSLISKQVYNKLCEHPEKLSIHAVPRQERTTRIVHMVLSNEQLASIVKNSRENATTVQGALCTSLLLAMAEHTTSAKPMNYNCMSIVNQRRFLNPPIGEEVGMYATAITTSHRVHPEPDFWTLAKEVKRKLDKAMASGEPLVSMGLADQIVPKKELPMKW